MKNLSMLLLMFLMVQRLFAQQVGIGTLNPHPSAALHIESDKKGILFPKISLQGKNDNTTIPNPAEGLVIYNNNSNALAGKGLYFNVGTGATPNWISVSDLRLPFYKGTSSDKTLFDIENYADAGSTLRAFSQTAFAVNAVSSSGTGVFAKSGTGNALEVDGKLKIAGNGQLPAPGKVLTSDANGNASWQGAVAFRASGVQSTEITQKFAANTEAKIAFAIEEYDLGNNYNDASISPHSSFIAPVAGIYHFEVLIQKGGRHEGINLLLNRVRNGAAKVMVESPLSDEIFASISTELKLDQGDMVHASINNYSSEDDTVWTDPSKAYFSGRLVVKL